MYPTPQPLPPCPLVKYAPLPRRVKPTTPPPSCHPQQKRTQGLLTAFPQSMDQVLLKEYKPRCTLPHRVIARKTKCMDGINLQSVYLVRHPLAVGFAFTVGLRARVLPCFVTAFSGLVSFSWLCAVVDKTDMIRIVTEVLRGKRSQRYIQRDSTVHIVKTIKWLEWSDHLLFFLFFIFLALGGRFTRAIITDCALSARKGFVW